MSDSGDDENGERSPWVTAGIFGALGAEFVGATVGGFVVGHWIDDALGIEPWGTLLGISLGLTAAGWHVYLITKRFVQKDESE